MSVIIGDLVSFKRDSTIYSDMSSMVHRGRMFTNCRARKGSVGLIVGIFVSLNVVELLIDGTRGAVPLDAIAAL